MQISLGYGIGSQTVVIPDENLMGVLYPNEAAPPQAAEHLIRAALNAPVAGPPLCGIVRPHEKVVLITSDITRPVPSHEIVPVVLDVLYEAGVRPADVTLVFALGSHRRHTEAEKEKLAGTRAYREIRCVDSDPDDCVCMGYTRRGTPVDITRVVAEADRRICIGNVEYHWFAGYSGGAKAIMPGVSSRAAIARNHSLMADPHARSAVLEGNPVRMDLEEAASICGVDFLINVVLDAHKHILYAAAGEMQAAHRAACRVLDRLYRKPIARQADIVIVSQGGAPKDMNLYQVQKALANAHQAVRPGGTVILVGRCQEGPGEPVFEAWMRAARTPGEILERIQREFCLGGHKAAAFAKVLAMAEILLVSEIEPDTVRAMGMAPAGSVQQALERAMARHGPAAQVLVMPFGGATLPQLEKSEGKVRDHDAGTPLY